MAPQTNLVSQDVVPLPVQQAASAQHLGAFIKAYRVSILQVIALIFVIILFGGGGAFLVGRGLIEQETLGQKVSSLVFGILLFGFLIGLFYLEYSAPVPQGFKRRVYLFQQGIVIEQRGQLQPFPWHQTAEFWEDVYTFRGYLNTTGSHSSYTLRRLDGYQVKLTDVTKGVRELGQAIAQGVTQALLPRAWQALQSGQTLSFAPFSINLQGISNGREWLPWSQVQEIIRNGGRVRVKKVGVSLAWGQALIPNCRVFTTIGEDLRKNVR